MTLRRLGIRVVTLLTAMGSVLGGQTWAQGGTELRSLSAARLAADRAERTKDWEAGSNHAARVLAVASDVAPALEQAFLMEAVLGHNMRTTQLARQIVAIDRSAARPRFWLALTAFAAGELTKADAELEAASPIGPDVSAARLARAWLKLAAGDGSGALRSFEKEPLGDQDKFSTHFHRAMMADILGRQDAARSDYEIAFAEQPTVSVLALAYAQHLARAGERRRGAEVLALHLAKEKEISTAIRHHPMVLGLQQRLQGDEPISLFAQTPAHGLALVFMVRSWGEVSPAAALIDLRLSLLARPNDALFLHALANGMELADRYDLAIEIYDRLPVAGPISADDVLRLKINALGRLDRVADLKILLNRRAAENVHEIWPLEELATVLRRSTRYSEAIEAYTSAIARVPRPRSEHTDLWYGRGRAYEGIGRWPEAEADLRQALALTPDNPVVLNFLGYSLLEHRRDVSGALPLIEKAAKLQPDNGAIIDSLGWAHYLRGDYAQAVRHLLRAVELDGGDATIADHAGDALWRVGRRQEAVSLWRQALTSDPAPELAGKIRTKLEKGLDPTPQAAARPSAPAAGSSGPAQLSADLRADLEGLEKLFRESFIRAARASSEKFDAVLKSKGSSLVKLCDIEKLKTRGWDSARKFSDEVINKLHGEPSSGSKHAKSLAESAFIIGNACFWSSLVSAREFSAAVWLDLLIANSPTGAGTRIRMHYAALIHAIGRGVTPNLATTRRWIERFKSSGPDASERDLMSEFEKLLDLEEYMARMSPGGDDRKASAAPAVALASDCLEVAVLAYCDALFGSLAKAEPDDDAELRNVRVAMRKLKAETASKLKGRTSDPLIALNALADLTAGKGTSLLVSQCAQRAPAIEAKVGKYCSR